MSENVYDLVVIGAGPAGYTGAIRAAQLGMKVACVEMEKKLGGTCLRVGCIPSKALLDSSEHYSLAQHKFKNHGINIEGISVDWPTMVKRKDKIVDQLTSGVEGLFRKNKVERVFGRGRLLPRQGDLNQVEVTGEGGTQILSTKRVLLATGSETIELPFMKFDHKRIVGSTGGLSLPEVPKHLVVVGGGYIGLELGSVYLRLGSKVTVVEFMDRIIPFTDGQLGRELSKSLTKQGMQFMLSTKCLGAQVTDKGVTVEVETNGQKSKIECDYVLVATGRRPFTDGLGEAGVKLDDKKRVVIDDHFRTNLKDVYAVGDIVPGYMLAHKAEDEAVAAVEIMAGQAGHVNYDCIPAVIYTWPEVASVGKTEEELKQAGRAYKSGSFPFLANGRAKAMDETEGFVKVLADAKTDRVLGVHIFGPRASDMIAEAVAVMEFGGSSEDIARTTHGHPTLSEALKEAALAVEKRTLNI